MLAPRRPLAGLGEAAPIKYPGCHETAVKGAVVGGQVGAG